ncbi:carbohydrate-binding protein SusD [Pedobacter sp. PACM 27299]|uniref:SusD family outer membrane lipoprotein NanU n=1 Tax=Pedobacter sp. PACM 27299 TaxID=1727164 RepID=UPI000705F20D|nr:SusD family outer membrane lipoprotein NanU [Pedobacter sp. PACM 27299]ALL08797.1 carbohydrate-binding protein SusD [Pedobacter sp. PACM 27299]
MKNNYKNIIAAALLVCSLGACKKSLDLKPISNLSDDTFWKTSDQYDAFVAGIHSKFRGHSKNFMFLGEMRSGIFGNDPGSSASFTGEASQGLERMWLQTLTLDAAGVITYGTFYSNINQLNLLIHRLNTGNVVTEATKKYELGIAYGMRAYYYYQLYRSWGNTVIITDFIDAANLDLFNLAKAASPAADVMKMIKEDIDLSIQNFGTDYSIKHNKGYWSKPATLMLKADVYLWTAHRTGGSVDATTAKTALTDIQTNVPALNLVTVSSNSALSPFADLFSTKPNAEFILASKYALNEAEMTFIPESFTPQTGLIANYYDSLANRKFNVTTDNYTGQLRAPIRIGVYRMFNDKDTRKLATIQAAYSKPLTGNYIMAGVFLKKFQGQQDAASRKYTNDYPIYRYADLLLLLAEAKEVLGESPAAEINAVRARAYGVNYNPAVQGFPNMPGDANIKQAILQERLFEFIGEGKRWYDLRRMGDSFVYANTAITAADAYKLLWPVDRATLTNNKALVQTTGYSQF